MEYAKDEKGTEGGKRLYFYCPGNKRGNMQKVVRKGVLSLS